MPVDIDAPAHQQVLGIELALVAQFAPAHHGREPHPCDPEHKYGQFRVVMKVEHKNPFNI